MEDINAEADDSTSFQPQSREKKTERAVRRSRALLICLDIALVVCAAGTVAIGAYVQVSVRQYCAFCWDDYLWVSVVLVLGGVSVFLGVFLSFLGSVKDNIRALISFVLLMAALVPLVAAGSIAWFLHGDELQERAGRSALNALLNAEADYDVDSEMGDCATRAFDMLQRDFRCCGVYNYTEWLVYQLPQGYPLSCCKRAAAAGGQGRDLVSCLLDTDPCGPPLAAWLKDKLSVVSVVACVAVTSVPVMTLAAALALYLISVMRTAKTHSSERAPICEDVDEEPVEITIEFAHPLHS